MTRVRFLTTEESGLVAGGQWQGRVAPLIAPVLEGAGEAAGESWYEWLTAPSYETQTASRFDPTSSPIIYSNDHVTVQENGFMWTDFNGDGRFEGLYHDSNGDMVADWSWNEQYDYWEKIIIPGSTGY